jgi:hypothetical protein
VVRETRETLEGEFQQRLESAVREAREEAQREAEVHLQRALSDVRETVQRQAGEELEQEFKKTLAETTDRLQAEWTDERARLHEQLNEWRTFAEVQKELAEAPSQAEILSRFVKLAEPFAASLGVYIIKADGLALWRSRGKAVFPEIISEKTTDPEFYFETINVRGKTVAAVCAAEPHKADALNFLVASVERAIEFFGLKLRASGPKPAVMAESPAAAAAAHPGAPPDQNPMAHADARRTARLLIAEIKLYHDKELREGRERSDIYKRLQKEIDRGREVYNQRVPSAVLGGRDYFHEELVRILTENDPLRLGAAYPGPMTSA